MVAWLTHWGRTTHICVNKLTITVSDNGLSPDRRQAIIWTNAGILLFVPNGTNFSEILIGIQAFSYKKMHLKMSSAKWRPFRFDLNVLMDPVRVIRSVHWSGFFCILIGTYYWIMFQIDCRSLVQDLNRAWCFTWYVFTIIKSFTSLLLTLLFTRLFYYFISLCIVFLYAVVITKNVLCPFILFMQWIVLFMAALHARNT